MKQRPYWDKDVQGVQLFQTQSLSQPSVRHVSEESSRWHQSQTSVDCDLMTDPSQNTSVKSLQISAPQKLGEVINYYYCKKPLSLGVIWYIDINIQNTLWLPHRHLLKEFRTCHPQICYFGILTVLSWRHLRSSRCRNGTLTSPFLLKNSL